MEYVDVQGARVPALGLGTWQLTGQHCRRTVATAVELGYEHFDTARSYGNEVEVGAGIRESGVARERIWVTTKLESTELGYDDAVRAVRESHHRLALDYIDLVLIHWPNAQRPMEETFRAFEQMRSEGLVRYFGVSNFTASMLEAAVQAAPILGVQVECHPFLPQPRLHSLATDRRLLFTAYSPLARGEVHTNPELRRIARSHGKSAAQVALRWLLQQPNTAAIPKASSREHLLENLQVFDFHLSAEELTQIAALSDTPKRFIDPDFAPGWEYP